MSGLGHLLEREGIATVCIALVREHAARMRPPRALWVPFPLGRPFGAPDDAGLQRRVLLAALDLLQAAHGPVLADFPEDAPPMEIAGDLATVCPVSFAPRRDDDQELAAILDEVTRLTPWYDLGRERRGRTTVGLSGLDIADAARFLNACAAGAMPPPPPDVDRVDALRWAADDLKAFYVEAVTARPGAADDARIEAWFWTGTAAARMLRRLRARCLADDDPALRDVGDFMLVASAYRG